MHKDNNKHKMQEWAAAQCIHIMIDRGLYFPNSWMQQILSLGFNPGGTTAELSSTNSRISILICHAQSTKTKVALKWWELAKDCTLAMRTLVQEELAAVDVHNKLCPNYNELLHCFGRFCTLLHTLLRKNTTLITKLFAHCQQWWSKWHPSLLAVAQTIRIYL